MIRPPGLWTPKSLWSYNPNPTGCVLYLPLWHPGLSGSVFKTPIGHICTATGTLAPPVYGATGRTFDGDDKIVIPHHACFNFASAMTLEAWVKVATPAALSAILAKDTGIGGGRSWAFYVDTNRKLDFFASDIGADASTTAIGDDVWTHIAVTWTSEVLISYFINGVAAGTDATVPAFGNTASDVWVGAREMIDSNMYLTGRVGEAWIYDGASPVGEILHNKNVTQWRYQ